MAMENHCVRVLSLPQDISTVLKDENLEETMVIESMLLNHREDTTEIPFIEASAEEDEDAEAEAEADEFAGKEIQSKEKKTEMPQREKVLADKWHNDIGETEIVWCEGEDVKKLVETKNKLKLLDGERKLKMKQLVLLPMELPTPNFTEEDISLLLDGVHTLDFPLMDKTSPVNPEMLFKCISSGRAPSLRHMGVQTSVQKLPKPRPISYFLSLLSPGSNVNTFTLCAEEINVLENFCKYLNSPLYLNSTHSKLQRIEIVYTSSRYDARADPNYISMKEIVRNLTESLKNPDSQISHLALVGFTFNSEAVKSIGDAIASDTCNLIHLDLRSNNCTNGKRDLWDLKDLKYILQCIKKKEKIITFGLNIVTNKQMQVLLESQVLSQLKVLKLYLFKPDDDSKDVQDMPKGSTLQDDIQSPEGKDEKEQSTEHMHQGSTVQDEKEPQGSIVHDEEAKQPTDSLQDKNVVQTQHQHQEEVIKTSEAGNIKQSTFVRASPSMSHIDGTGKQANKYATVINLAEALMTPDSKVRFLDLRTDVEMGMFWKTFTHHMKKDMKWECSLKAMRITTGQRKVTVSITQGLLRVLQSTNCPLSWFDLQYSKDEARLNKEEEWGLAKAISSNVNLTAFRIPWTDSKAEKLAESSIKKNREEGRTVLYQQGKMRAPFSAKLIICGNEKVGKTTIYTHLVQTQPDTTFDGLIPLVATYCSDHIPPHKNKAPAMRMHPIMFKNESDRNGASSNLKLWVCDIAGNKEYEVLHSYFMCGSNKNIFLVVCKFTSTSQQQDFEAELEYWLRFIVSHRSVNAQSTQSKPRVIVVVNFFNGVMNSLNRNPYMLQELQDKLAFERSQRLIHNFSNVLDFDKVYGVVAKRAFQLVRVRQSLYPLLSKFLKNREQIPELCHEVVSTILPNMRPRKPETKSVSSIDSPVVLTQSIKPRVQERVPFLTFSDILMQYNKHHNGIDKERELEAALVELHNQGEILFFPKSSDQKSAQESSHALVITDPSWFCNNNVKILKSKKSANKTRWTWDVVDIKIELQRNHVPAKHFDEILRYMQRLEMCYPVESDDKQDVEAVSKYKSPQRLFFPALVEAKEVSKPQLAQDHQMQSESENGSDHGYSVNFFGRRLRCKDNARNLIPSGVFSRLQLHLRHVCGNQSYKVARNWASFVRDTVAAIVRFGSGNITAKRDITQDWIDILIFFPRDRRKATEGSSSQHSKDYLSTAEQLMEEIKSYVYDICATGGIPTVELEEWVLRDQSSTGEDAVSLKQIQETVKKDGIMSFVAWPSQKRSTEVSKLLMPKELNEHLKFQVDKFAEIETEFAPVNVEPPNGETNQPVDHDKSQDKDTDQEPESDVMRVLKSIQKDLRGMESRQRARDREIMNMLTQIQRDIGSVVEAFKQMESNIIKNCSTTLLKEGILGRGLTPRLPYLVDRKEGKLRAMMDLFTAQRARIHFMCEAPKQGAHQVQNQKGKSVVIKHRDWFVKAAPFLLPAFKVVCCAARIAATIYLPGSQNFIPLPNALEALGFSSQTLQQEILPKAIPALLRGLPEASEIKKAITSADKLQNEDSLLSVVYDILEDKEVDMHKDFALYAVKFKFGDEKIHWVCQHHLEGGTRVYKKNPFSTSVFENSKKHK